MVFTWNLGFFPDMFSGFFLDVISLCRRLCDGRSELGHLVVNGGGLVGRLGEAEDSALFVGPPTTSKEKTREKKHHKKDKGKENDHPVPSPSGLHWGPYSSSSMAPSDADSYFSSTSITPTHTVTGALEGVSFDAGGVAAPRTLCGVEATSPNSRPRGLSLRPPCGGGLWLVALCNIARARSSIGSCVTLISLASAISCAHSVWAGRNVTGRSPLRRRASWVWAEGR